MPKVSVLMNCFNGEKYLTEALDSVFAQSFNDWEIVFIDNCSTDNSAEIAKKYGEKIKYYKTEQNIPLGAARKFGISKCSSKYVAFLDTDDIWLKNTLEILYKNIVSDNYALAYGHQLLINSEGNDIGKITNIYAGERGGFLGKLLLQFDIPIVSTIIDKEKMIGMNLNFDENIFGSEEYCLFTQMSVKSNFFAIDEYLVKYRVHNSLTTKLDDKIYKERFYTLNKIITENPGIEQKFRKEFKEAFARGAYYKAQYFMKLNKKVDAFKSLLPYMFVGFRYFFLALLTLSPNFIWKYIQNKKYKRYP